MSRHVLPRREAGSALLLLLLFAVLLLTAAPRSQSALPFLCTALALAHAALFWPAIARHGPASWLVLPLLLSLPCLASVSYAGAGGRYLVGSLVLLLCALGAGVGARSLHTFAPGRVYLPLMVLAFVVPHAASYLVAEFGPQDAASDWRRLSPLGAAQEVARGGEISWGICLFFLFWPVLGIALKRKPVR